MDNTNERLRLVVLGDPHIAAEHQSYWEQLINDINQLSPQAVLIVGDLTKSGPTAGTPPAMRQAVAILNKLDAPWYSVIGNHDLESPHFASDDAAVASFISFCGRDTPWFRVDLGPVTVLGLSGTSFRRNAEARHEVVFESEQLQWLEEQLQLLADQPVFIVAHVPPIGSGLVGLAELHAQGGNAVANQNHCPGRIMKIVWNNPNILAWLSGHNHLGQHYRDAIALTLGVHFIHVGVARQARDGFCHSRVIDVLPKRLDILTFDHATRCLDDQWRYTQPHSLTELLAWRQEHQKRLYIERDPSTMRQGPSPQWKPSCQAANSDKP